MGVYAVTGSASGMGSEVVRKLRAQGHTVIGVDVKEAEVVADLSTAQGRRTAVTAVLEKSGGVLDGAVLAAGLGPDPGKERMRLLAEVNYLGVVELLEGWRPTLAEADEAKVVVFSSNSTTTVPVVPRRTVKAYLDRDIDKVLTSIRIFGSKGAPPMAYAGSKIAVSRWVRRAAVSPEWAGEGIRLNALAPGAIMTPLLEHQLSAPSGKAVNSFPVPIGGFGNAGQLADWVVFMLSDAADFLCGSVVFVDGGTDAYFRSDDWPRPVPVRGLLRYGLRFRGFGRRRRD
ncbi:SDR family oxidoreductase [Gordonia sp. NPDC003429]